MLLIAMVDECSVTNDCLLRPTVKLSTVVNRANPPARPHIWNANTVTAEFLPTQLKFLRFRNPMPAQLSAF